MKKHKKLWSTGIIIVLIGILVAAGNFYYTKDRQIFGPAAQGTGDDPGTAGGEAGRDQQDRIPVGER